MTVTIFHCTDTWKHLKPETGSLKATVSRVHATASIMTRPFIVALQWHDVGGGYLRSTVAAASKHHRVLATLYLTFLVCALPPIKINGCLHTAFAR